jgi:hypothetical protein
MPNPKNIQRLRLGSICVAIAFVQGWIILKMAPGLLVNTCLYLGIVGAIPFLLLNGVHGDAEGPAGLVGGALFVIVNASVYYGIIILIAKVARKLQHRKSN